MEKFSVEIETDAGWVTFHSIMRPGLEKARSVLEELISQHPTAKFRLVRWTGEAVD